MRILDEDTDKALKNIFVLLTQAEASELRDVLNGLILSKLDADHSHINDIEYNREITIALYEDDAPNTYNKRVKKLILKGE